MQKQDPYICYLQETHLKPRDTYILKVRGWKKVFHANGNQNKETKKRQRRTLHNSEGIKRSIQKEIITTINIYAPNI